MRFTSQVLSGKMYIQGFEQRKCDERTTYREVWAGLKEPVIDGEAARTINRGGGPEGGDGFGDPQE